MMFFRRNEKLFVLRCRTTESEVQQTLKHQLLDCEDLFLLSDLAEPALKISVFRS